MQDTFGKTALMWACEVGFAAIVDRLIEKGARLDTVNSVKRNCLHCVIASVSASRVRQTYETSKLSKHKTGRIFDCSKVLTVTSTVQHSISSS